MSQEKINIDNLFKDKLKGFSETPSDKVWSQVNASLAQQGLYNSFWARSRKWATVVVLLIFASGLFWLVSDSPERVFKTTNTASINTIPQNDLFAEDANAEDLDVMQNDPSNEGFLVTEDSENILFEQDDIAKDDIPVMEESVNNREVNIVDIQMISDPVEEKRDNTSVLAFSEKPEIQMPLETILEESSAKTSSQRIEFPLYRMQMKENQWSSTAYNTLEEQHFFSNSNTETGITQISDLTPWHRFSQKPSYLCVGASAGPEYLFYSRDKRNSGMGYGIDFYYNKSGFILRSGLQMSRYGDQGEYELNYQRVDSLGYMYTVESFTFDPNNPDSVIFNLKIEGVYDSVNVSERRVTDAYYSYLQLPFMVGYTVAGIGNLSFDFTAGPVFNILIKENNPNPEVPVGNDIYMGEMVNNSDPWIKTNIQFRASMAMHYRFSKNFRLSLEPTYNYYMDPVYTDNINDVSSPYSLGARIGLMYKF